MFCMATRMTTWPVDQARTMRKELSAFHADFTYYERPEAGHWWGNECMDWPPLIEFPRTAYSPQAGRSSADRFSQRPTPGISAWCDWAGVEQQIKPLVLSKITATLSADKKKLTAKNGQRGPARPQARELGAVRFQRP